MYSRLPVDAPDGATPRTFGVSGKLWHGVLVMVDRDTGSLWTQLDGRAIEGEAQAQLLVHVPSVFTTWAAWRHEYPHTLVLEKGDEAREQGASHYADYLADPDRLFLERLGERLGAIGPKDVVLNVSSGDAALAVTQGLMRERGMVNALVGALPAALVLDARTDSVRAFSRRIGERVFVLEVLDGGDPDLFRDALSGEVHGLDELDELRVDRAYWYAWPVPTRVRTGCCVSTTGC